MFWVDIVIFVVFCPNDHKSLWPLCDYTCATYDMVKAVFRKLFFFYLVFLSRTFVIHRTAGEEEAISLTPSYHLHLLRRHLDINPAITAESSPLHIASSWMNRELSILRFQKLVLSIQAIVKFPIYRPNLGKVDIGVLRDNLFDFHKGDNAEIHFFAFVLMWSFCCSRIF